ncbi:MAG: FTR1 family protein [Candidatus Bathyarchaeia archaeon]
MHLLFGQFLLVFREALEAALIIVVSLAYLKRTDKISLSRYVWYGVYVSVAVSLISGASVWFIYGSLTRSVKALFEGVAALFAVLVLSSMIYWMATKGERLKREVERRVEAIVTRGTTLAMTSFSFTVVFREGLETVLFLTPFLLNDAIGTLAGALLGVIASSAIAYAIFIVGIKINMREFFYFSSILLVVLSGGLAGYGVHELVEYSEEMGVELGWLSEYAYDLNIPKDSPLHHNGAIGSIIAVMFGYTVSAEWARVIVHLAYLAIALPSIILIYRKQMCKHAIGKFCHLFSMKQ